MYQTTSQKIYNFILNLISKYLVWIVIAVILILYWFYPEALQILGSIVLLWGPIIALVFGLIIIITANTFKFSKQREQGITQYEIIISKYEIYLADLLIYLGTIAILLTAWFVNQDGVGVADLIQALIFFILANWIKQIFYRKINL
jgi:hypothetical protein